MRVAYLINQYPAVSHSFIRREIQALERRGVEVLRIAVRGWNAELADDADRVERTRTRYVLEEGSLALAPAVIKALLTRPRETLRAAMLACRMSRGSDRPLPVHLIYLAEACRILGWLREGGVQHVHAHFGTNAAEVAMLVHALGGPAWSFTVHGPEEFDRASQLGLAHKLLRCAFAVAISSYGRGQLYRLVEPGQWSRMHVVHCGLERDFYAVPGLPAHATARRLICVGRLCEQKGQLLLIEAVRRLAERGIEFELVLAGDGEMRGVVEAHIERYRLQARVRITGWISSAQVRAELLAARALVLPSFAEGLPVVIMEAMALGRPVLSTYVAGIPELVRPGVDGWLVPAGDVDALAEAMRACLACDSPTLRNMGEAARTRVLERHDVDREAATLADLFAREIARDPSCRFPAGRPTRSDSD